MISDMCNKAGLQRKTNHSLWATAAMALFEPNAPEKVIQEHRSLEALHLYECSTEHQNCGNGLPEGHSSCFCTRDVSFHQHHYRQQLQLDWSENRVDDGLYNQHILWNPPIASQPPTTEAAMLMLSAREIEEVFSDF